MHGGLREKVLANLAVFGLAIVFGLGVYALIMVMMVIARFLGFEF